MQARRPHSSQRRCAGSGIAAQQRGDRFAVPRPGRLSLGICEDADVKPKSLGDSFAEKFIPEPNTGCWLWIGAIQHRGYGMLMGRRNRKALRATHVSLQLAGRPVPAGLWALHSCDTPSCVNPDHLFHGDRRANTEDRDRKGRNKIVRGSKSPRSQITESKALLIKAGLLEGKTQRAVSAQLSVSLHIVKDIARGRTWAHV